MICLLVVPEYPVRLSHASSGCVQLYHQYTWGALCTSHLSLDDAHTICRTLKFPAASTLTSNCQSSLSFRWPLNVQCQSSSSSSFTDCTLSNYYISPCTNYTVHCQSIVNTIILVSY